MKTTMKDIKKRCEEENKEIWEIALEDEMELSKKSKEEIFDKLQRALDVMKSSATAALDKDVRSMTGMSGGNAKIMNDYFLSNDTVLGDIATNAMAMAFSTSEVNASMGKIVAAPTAGSAGILPATLMAMYNKYHYSDEELKKAILVATEIGQIIADSATFAGAEGGCQAECGSASAMAAAAICYLRGADINAQENAASISLLIILGLVCDPIGGMVEFPCNLRNASGVINAMAAADMAMAGVHMFVGFDECVETMKRVGDSLPSALRETGEGGIAIAQSALKLKAKYIDKKED